MSETYQYDVAISFAGEDRKFAEFIASSLAPDFRVFFDEFEQVELWGSDLSISLPSKYIASRYCIILQSNEYLERAWTTLERQAIIFEFLERRGNDYILPILIGSCSKSIPGLSKLTGYISARSERDWLRAVDLLRSKLAK